MKICGIYKITNPKKKVYIGRSIDIKKRFRIYKCLGCTGQYKLYRSLKKYGVDKHKFEIIHQCEPEKLDELEIYYIELFQCFNSKYGLNLLSGGNGKFKVSDETRRKISEAHKGKILSEDHKRKIGETLKGINTWAKGMPSPKKGVKLSDETRRKMSEAKKDNTIYTFMHPEYGIEKCTRYELYTKYNLDAGNLCNVIKRRKNLIKNWRVA